MRKVVWIGIDWDIAGDDLTNRMYSCVGSTSEREIDR